MALFVMLVNVIIGRLNHEDDILKYQKSDRSPKYLNSPVAGYRSKKSEDLVMSLIENAYEEDYYETTGSEETTGPEETTLHYDADNDYESKQQTKGKVTYLDPDMFYNLLFGMVKEQQVRQEQDVHSVINDENYFRYGIMLKRHRDDHAVGDYKKIESKYDIMNVLLGRNANVPNRLLETQSQSERQRGGNDNVIIYEPARNNHKFINHFLDRYDDMQNMFLMKEIKKDGNVQPSAYDTKRNNNKVTNMLFGGSVNNMPQSFQNKQLNFFKALLLNGDKQNNKIYGIVVNYHDKNETNKNENITDRKKNYFSNSEKYEDKGYISIVEKKEILLNVENIKDKENISDNENEDDSLNTEVENDSSESSVFYKQTLLYS